MTILTHRDFIHFLQMNMKGSFFSQLKKGTLDKNTYIEYVEQDSIYLYYYQIALENTARLARSAKTKLFFEKASNDIKHEIAAQFEQPKLVNANKHTLRYIDYLMTHTRNDFSEALSAVFPCFYIYYAVAHQLDSVIEHPFNEWFSCYQSELFVKQAQTTLAMINEDYQQYEDSNYYITILNKGMELEFHFHQALMAKASLADTKLSPKACATAS